MLLGTSHSEGDDVADDAAFEGPNTVLMRADGY